MKTQKEYEEEIAEKDRFINRLKSDLEKVLTAFCDAYQKQKAAEKMLSSKVGDL